MNRHRIVIGGGISGLTTAYYLARYTAEENPPSKIILLEAQDRLGGVIRTLSYDACLIEAGADAFYGGGQEGGAALTLCQELHLQDKLLEANPCFRRFFIFKKNQLFSIPEALFSFSAGSVASFWKLSCLNLFEKCRMALEPWIMPRKENTDESCGQFFTRRLGTGFYRKVILPILRGVYLMDPENLSMEAMFPSLKEMEQAYGSLGKAVWHRQKKETRPEAFLTLHGGLEILPQTLVRRLGACELRTHAPVRRCDYENGWKITLESGEIFHAADVCLAMTASDAAKLFQDSLPELSEVLSDIPYEPIAAINFMFKTQDIAYPILDFGFIVPEEHLLPDAFSSLKWLGTTPDGRYLCLRAFVSEKLFHENEDQLQDRALTIIKNILGISAQANFSFLARYPEALPQYQVGHLDRVRTLQEKLEKYPGLYLTGNGFYGFGIADCIYRAKMTAKMIAKQSL